MNALITNQPTSLRYPGAKIWSNGSMVYPFTHYEKTVLPDEVSFANADTLNPNLAYVLVPFSVTNDVIITCSLLFHGLFTFLNQSQHFTFWAIAWTDCMSKSNSTALRLPLPPVLPCQLSFSLFRIVQVAELIGSLKLGNVWFCVQLIHRQR